MAEVIEPQAPPAPPAPEAAEDEDGGCEPSGWKIIGVFGAGVEAIQHHIGAVEGVATELEAAEGSVTRPQARKAARALREVADALCAATQGIDVLMRIQHDRTKAERILALPAHGLVPSVDGLRLVERAVRTPD